MLYPLASNDNLSGLVIGRFQFFKVILNGEVRSHLMRKDHLFVQHWSKNPPAVADALRLRQMHLQSCNLFVYLLSYLVPRLSSTFLPLYMQWRDQFRCHQ